MVSFGEEAIEELVHLLDRIPFVGGLRKDVSTLRGLLYTRRPPRIAIVARSEDADSLLDRLIARPASLLAPSTEGWLGVDGAGVKVEWLKLDPSAPLDTQALEARAPDVLVVFVDPAESTSSVSLPAIDVAARLVAQIGAPDGAGAGSTKRPPCFVVLAPPLGASTPESTSPAGDLEADVRAQAQRLGLSVEAVFARGLEDLDLARLSDALVRAVPIDARLEAARAFRHAVTSRRETARMLVQSASALAMTVALTPIPFSTLGVLAPMQIATVTGIAYLGGRAWSYRSAAEWMASAGIVSGLGLGFRWTARELIKFIPGAGSIISAGIAGAGTTALGRSAIAYFLHGAER